MLNRMTRAEKTVEETGETAPKIYARTTSKDSEKNGAFFGLVRTGSKERGTGSKDTADGFAVGSRRNSKSKSNKGLY